MDERAEVVEWYRMEPVDMFTWRLWKIELVGRRVGKKRLIMESTPIVVKANWKALSDKIDWTAT